MGGQHIPAGPTFNGALPIASSWVRLVVAVAVAVAGHVDSEGVCEAEGPDGEGIVGNARLGCDLHLEGDLESAE